MVRWWVYEFLHVVSYFARTCNKSLQFMFIISREKVFVAEICFWNLCWILWSKGQSLSSRWINICWNHHCTGSSIQYLTSCVDLDFPVKTYHNLFLHVLSMCICYHDLCLCCYSSLYILLLWSIPAKCWHYIRLWVFACSELFCSHLQQVIAVYVYHQQGKSFCSRNLFLKFKTVMVFLIFLLWYIYVSKHWTLCLVIYYLWMCYYLLLLLLSGVRWRISWMWQYLSGDTMIRVATNLENLEYSGISLNMENSGNSQWILCNVREKL